MNKPNTHRWERLDLPWLTPRPEKLPADHPDMVALNDNPVADMERITELVVLLSEVSGNGGIPATRIYDQLAHEYPGVTCG